MTTTLTLRRAAVLAAAFALTTPTWATTIDFDGTGAPTGFAYTTPLSTLYASLGITFSGSGGANGLGGSVLNKDGGFGFLAHSGTDLLAMSTALHTGNVETISFATPMTAVSIWAAYRWGSTPNNAGTITMDAFASNGALLATNSINASSTWAKLSIAEDGISSIRLTGPASTFQHTDRYYAYDDLQVTAVPEPASLAMLVAGLGLVGSVFRKRQFAA
jgi:hypothetical protein